LTFDEPLAKSAIYTISYRVYVPEEGNEGKEVTTGPGVVLTTDFIDPEGVIKLTMEPDTIETDSWTEVSVRTAPDSLNGMLKSIDFLFATDNEVNHPDVWYIDDIKISQKIVAPDYEDPDYMEYEPLKDVYKDYFLIGTTSGNWAMSDDKLEIIKYHFNAFTPENEMKPEAMQNVEGIFTFETLDEQFEKVQGLNLIGHTLGWHSQTPDWMWGVLDPTSSEEAQNEVKNKAKANMTAHIEAVMNKYGPQLTSIDVVNEAFADGRNYDDWKLNLRDNQGWFTVLGAEWVEYTFVETAKIVDENGWDCKLYYNDYNLDDPYKAAAVYNMVKDINERYAETRTNGKPLIEGIGMQAHNNKNTVPANVENSINLFSSLPGVSISITELDITYGENNTLTDKQELDQAIKYAQLFDIFMKNAAGPANDGQGRIERVTFWGTNDADSWRGSQAPLLFDKNLRAKEAFKAVLNPEPYLGMVKPPQDIPEAISNYGTPILGTEDAIWDDAEIINVNTQPSEQAEAAGATAVAKALWDNDYFYVRLEVADSVLDKTSTNAWEQDSVEIFFSETANRNPNYTDGDGQYRVNFEGLESFKSDAMAEGFESWASVTDNGYIVEMKIPFRIIQPQRGANVSFDVQINDVTEGPDTRLMTVWSDLDANGYNTPVNWGSIILDHSSIPYTAVAGGAAKVTTTTSVALEFETPVPGLTADDITITAGTASAKKGTLSVVDGSNDTEYILNISGVTKEGTINLKITKEGVDPEVKVIDVHKKSSSGGGGGGGGGGTPAVKDPETTDDTLLANIVNKPVKGTVKDTPQEILDIAANAFRRNKDFVVSSYPITLAAPPEENSGLTPVSVPLPEGTEFTALVSPNPDGSFTPVPTYVDENGTVYALIDEEKTLISVTINTSFSDVPANSWFAEYAKTASELGIILGYGGSLFGPNDTVTNQQTVTMLMRTIGFNASYDSVLEDAVAKDIKYASELNNTDYTSRADTAILIKDILATLGFDVALDESERAELLASFNDLEGLTEEATLSIAVAIKYGILEGTYIGEDYSTMEPDTLLTRAQMATIATRIVDFLTEK
jgi:endo-1,4-beta-xylanase